MNRQGTTPSKRLRSQEVKFNWKKNCFYCAKPIITRRTKDYSQVSFIDLKEKILTGCTKRDKDDPWSSEMKLRLSGCLDLIAAEGFYHRTCYKRFMLNKTKIISSNRNAIGRKIDDNKLNYFNMLCNWLDSEAEKQ